MKASIRAKVEHPFRIIKRQFGFVADTGVAENDNQLAMLFTGQPVSGGPVSGRDLTKTGNNVNGEETV